MDRESYLARNLISEQIQRHMGTSERMGGQDDEGVVQAILEDYLDEKDYRIFKALNDDGRISDTELAERVGLSRTAARRRRKKLQSEGIIEILAVLILQKADLAYADVRVTLDPKISQDERAAFIKSLTEEELVISLDSCMDDFDIFARVWNTSLDAIKTYLWELFEDEDAVAEYSTTPVVKTWKAWNKVLELPPGYEEAE
jgi:DNA-binding Lrp family transcriptional regulator